MLRVQKRGKPSVQRSPASNRLRGVVRKRGEYDDRMRVKCMGILMGNSNESDGEVSSMMCMTQADRQVIKARTAVQVHLGKVSRG